MYSELVVTPYKFEPLGETWTEIVYITLCHWENIPREKPPYDDSSSLVGNVGGGQPILRLSDTPVLPGIDGINRVICYPGVLAALPSRKAMEHTHRVLVPIKPPPMSLTLPAVRFVIKRSAPPLKLTLLGNPLPGNTKLVSLVRS